MTIRPATLVCVCMTPSAQDAKSYPILRALVFVSIVLCVIFSCGKTCDAQSANKLAKLNKKINFRAHPARFFLENYLWRLAAFLASISSFIARRFFVFFECDLLFLFIPLSLIVICNYCIPSL